jgi:hypothetical protein
VRAFGWDRATGRLLALGGLLVMAAPVQAQVLPVIETGEGNRVPACVTPDRLMAFIERRNGRLAPRFRPLGQLYRRHGEALGVRWDVAFLQMMVETAALTFHRVDGTSGDVRPDDNNFAGIGAVGDGRPGEIFETVADGVRAHLEHLLIYAGRRIDDPVAERTRKVQAWGVLEPWLSEQRRPITFSDLALRWAPGNIAYLETIIRLGQQYQRLYCDGAPVIAQQPRAPEIADGGWAFAHTRPRGDTRQAEPAREPNYVRARSGLGVPVPHEVRVRPEPPAPFHVAALMPLPTPNRSARKSVAAPVTRPPATVHRPAEAIVGLTAAARPEPAPASGPPRLDPMAGEEQRIRDLISDRTVLLKTSIGAEVPIAFRGDGTMRGDAGSLAFFLGAQRDGGKWWVEKGRLCQRWRVWLDRDTHCIRMKEQRGLIHWRSDGGESGTARIVRR